MQLNYEPGYDPKYDVCAYCSRNPCECEVCEECGEFIEDCMEHPQEPRDGIDHRFFDRLGLNN